MNWVNFAIGFNSIFLCFSDLLSDVAVFEHPNIVGHVQLTLDDDNGQMLLGAR